MRLSPIILGGFLIFLLSCGSSDEPAIRYSVPEEVQTHIDTFLEEAKARGQDLSSCPKII